MKILALDQGEYIGGAELFFSDLLTRISGEFEIHLIVGTNKKYQEKYKGTSIILHELDLPSLKPLGIKTYKNYKKIQKEVKKIINEVEPDRIISNTVRTHLFVSALAKEKNIPLIWMAHDLTFPKLFLKWFKRYPQKIISCSKFVETYYKNAGYNEKISHEVLYPFGIDQAKIKALEKISKEKTIGMIGKFIPWKGHDLFIEVAEKIHESYPNYCFEVIGTPYENNQESKLFYETCKKIIKNNKSEDYLKIKEKVPDVLSHIAQWEILVHCSREPEPLGRVVLEGMSAGCGVIASDLGGVKEVVKNQETGLISESSAEAIFKAVEYYIKDSPFREKLGSKAQGEILKKYEWKRVIEKFKAILAD